MAISDPKQAQEVAGGGPCCWLDLCCPPGGLRQAEELAEHLDIPVSAAMAVLKKYRLVPRDVDPAVHGYLNGELRAYLAARGEAAE